jgi:hypothetical protein
MKKLLITIIGIALFTATADAATRVRGHYNRKSGTYTQAHYRSSADRLKYNNYSTKGNRNPYTGKKGYKKAYK